MIRIDITAKLSKSGDHVGLRQDVATASWNGRSFRAVSRSGASMELARLLLDSGCPDQPWTAGRPGRQDFSGPSLHNWAKFTVSDPDSGAGPKFVPWVPRPDVHTEA